MEKKLKKNLVKEKSYLLESKDAENKGITLVALVITVVVLLILAGVSIGTLFGDHGIIKKAQEAVDRTQEGVDEEQREFKNLLEQLNSLGNTEGGSSEGNTEGGNTEGGNTEGGNTEGGNTEGGNTEGGGDIPEEPQVPEGWDTAQVTPVESADGKMVPVPNGFTASEVSRKVTIGGKEVDDIENTVAGGFVIYQGTDPVNNDNVDSSNARTTRNQFVWVPYSDFESEATKMFTENTSNPPKPAGQLYNFGTNSSPKNPAEKIAYPTTKNSGNREPDVVTSAIGGQDSTSGSSYDADGNYLSIVGISSTGKTGAEAFKTQLENEFKDMKDSVERYGGFFIGRYETGGLNTAVTNPAKVVKGQGDGQINKKNWYTQYQKSKLMANGTSATSTIIWGCQWDATMNWFLSQGGDNEAYVTNSSGKGNYSYEAITYVDSTGATVTKNANDGQIIPTGSSEQTKVNNIYDMAGNIYDWTMEADGGLDRMVRRGLLQRRSWARLSSVG